MQKDDHNVLIGFLIIVGVGFTLWIGSEIIPRSRALTEEDPPRDDPTFELQFVSGDERELPEQGSVLVEEFCDEDYSFGLDVDAGPEVSVQYHLLDGEVERIRLLCASPNGVSHLHILPSYDGYACSPELFDLTGNFAGRVKSYSLICDPLTP